MATKVLPFAEHAMHVQLPYAEPICGSVIVTHEAPELVETSKDQLPPTANSLVPSAEEAMPSTKPEDELNDCVHVWANATIAPQKAMTAAAIIFFAFIQFGRQNLLKVIRYWHFGQFSNHRANRGVEENRNCVNPNCTTNRHHCLNDFNAFRVAWACKSRPAGRSFVTATPR